MLLHGTLDLHSQVTYLVDESRSEAYCNLGESVQHDLLYLGTSPISQSLPQVVVILSVCHILSINGFDGDISSEDDGSKLFGFQFDLRLWVDDAAKEDAIFVHIVHLGLGEFAFSNFSSFIVVGEDFVEDLRHLVDFFWSDGVHLRVLFL